MSTVSPPIAPHISLFDRFLQQVGQSMDYDYKEALIGDEKLSPLVRVMVPFLVVANIAIFIWSNIMVDAATVTMEVSQAP